MFTSTDRASLYVCKQVFVLTIDIAISFHDDDNDDQSLTQAYRF